MASTYSTNLKIELIGTGDQSGTWGTTTNVNLGTAIEEAITGIATANFPTDADLTLTLSNTNTTQVPRHLVLDVTSGVSLTTTRNLIVPTVEKQYLVWNNTTGGQSIVVKTSAGTGITVPNGAKVHVVADGTNVVRAFDNADINSGSIDGTPIGASSASTGNFTTLSINGTAISATATELNVLDGITATTAELNILDGVTATNTEINVLDGITATTAELNILDGVTATSAELNILDGVTATTAELNYLDITTLGTSEASKAVTADANGDVTLDEELKAKSYNETVEAITSTGGAATINCENANLFTHTLSENVTYTFSSPPTTGTGYGFTLKVVQDSTARTITWPASVKWGQNLTPTISTGSGEVDVFTFFTHDGGTNWYGFAAGQDMS
jgi:hypothetical protein